MKEIFYLTISISISSSENKFLENEFEELKAEMLGLSSTIFTKY
jgi:hypothetical protein